MTEHAELTIPITAEGPMKKLKRTENVVKKARQSRSPQFVMRVNILLTQEQFVTLQGWARDEGRMLPNLVRRLIDLAIAQRK